MTCRRARGWFLATAAFGLAALPTRAQEAPAPASAGAARARSLSLILPVLSRGSGVTVVADSTLSGAQAPMPREATTAANLEDHLDALVKELPTGTAWAKLMLPSPPAGRAYRGDDLADFALAQARLFGTAGAATPGKVEVLGQKIAEEKAEPVVATLGLKPFYVLSNPSARTPESRSDFSKLTSEQQQQWAQQQAQKLLQMEPQARGQYMQQLFQQQGLLLRSLMQSMTPEQRRDFFTGIRGLFGGMNDRGGGNVFFLGGPP